MLENGEVPAYVVEGTALESHSVAPVCTSSTATLFLDRTIPYGVSGMMSNAPALRFLTSSRVQIG